LDWTKLTAEADKITSAPDFNQNVKAFQKQWNESQPLDQLDDKEAKEKYVTLHMEKIAKQHGLSEQTMKALVTQRMGQIYSEGAGEMAAHSDAIVGPLKKQLAEIEATKGPNSPEAAELRERIAKFDKVTGEYKTHLGSVGEVYKNMFPVPPSFMERFVSAFSFIADIAAAVASCIPGVGQAIGATYFGVKAVVAAAKGDVLGMFSSVASALPGLGAAIGGAAGAAVNTAGRAMQTGIGVGTSIAEGNVLGALGSLAGAGAGMTPVLDYAQRGLKMADGISRGDVSAIAGATGGILGPLSSNPVVQGIARNPVVQGVAQATQTAVPFIDAISKGDMSRALGAVAGPLGSLATGSPEAQRTLSLVNDGAAFASALQSGDYGRALSAFGTSFENMGAGPEAQAVVRSFNQFGDVLGAFGTGNPSRIAEVMQGALGDIAGGSLTRAFSGLSDVAGQMLDSPSLGAVMDLAGAGSRFLGGIGTGDLSTALKGVNHPDANQLAGWLDAARPLVQSMARGDYQRAMAELSKNPLTREIADQMSLLNPVADLAQSDFLKSLEQTLDHLNRLSHLTEEMHRFEDLEDAARQLQKRFGPDANAMAEHLLDRSGYVAPGPVLAMEEHKVQSASMAALRSSHDSLR
jgi:hypothetical protein